MLDTWIVSLTGFSFSGFSFSQVLVVGRLSEIDTILYKAMRGSEYRITKVERFDGPIFGMNGRKDEN